MGTAEMDSGNNQVSASVTVRARAQLELGQVPDRTRVLVGDRLTYTISVVNQSAYALGDIRLTDQLPAGVNLVMATASQGTVNTGVETVEWEPGVIDSGGWATLVAVVAPQETGWLTNRVELSSEYVDPADPGLRSELRVEAVATPPLAIRLEGNRMVLSWPALAEGYWLQVSEGLTTPMVWAFDGNPQEVLGDQVTVTVKVTNGRRFYRLIQP
jgi:uncharacterized repeat protein (TIGR01451 family)